MYVLLLNLVVKESMGELSKLNCLAPTWIAEDANEAAIGLGYRLIDDFV